MPTQPETMPAKLEALLSEHFDDAARFCRFLAGGDDAGRELHADATALAALHFRQLRKPDRFRQWFYAIIRNRWRTTYSRQRMTSHLDEASLYPSDRSPELSMETALVDSALAKLPENERAAVVLHYIEDLPVGEVARVLGISRPAVKTRLHRARRRLAPIMRMLMGDAQPAPVGGTTHEN
jgi:RNA polymerase sigma factor (sigma-70 family)